MRTMRPLAWVAGGLLLLALVTVMTPTPSEAQGGTVILTPTQAAYLDGLEGLIGTTNTSLTTIDGRVDGLEGFLATIAGDTTDIEAALELIDNAAGITPSDGFANPTNALVVYALNGCWYGTTWERCTGASSSTQGGRQPWDVVIIDPETDLPAVLDTGGGVGVPYSSVGTAEDEHVVSTVPVILEAIIVTNTNVGWRYLRCENDTAANTAPSTDTPEFEMGIPPSGGFAYSFGKSGRTFSIALTCWIVTGASVNNTDEAGADEVYVDYIVKP